MVVIRIKSFSPCSYTDASLPLCPSHRVVVFAFLVCAGCGLRHPVPQTWRVVKRDAKAVLIPPDVKRQDLRERRFGLNLAAGHGDCAADPDAVSIRVRGRRARVTVRPSELASQPVGGLGAWAYRLEEQRCVPVGEGMKLAEWIVDSVPLELGSHFRLLYADDRQTGAVDVGPEMRLQVVSPLWKKPGVGSMADGPYSVTASGHSLTVKSTDNLLGYETALYSLHPRTGGIGYSIDPLYADRHVDGKVDRTAQPVTNYFRFPLDAGFYRIFYKSGQNEYTALMLAGRTPSELDRANKILDASGASASCANVEGGMCIAIPKAVAVQPFLPVTVNGVEVLVFRGGTVFQAIRRAGELQPNRVVAQLRVYKPWNGRLAAVTFDRSDDAILKLVLRGGETISWK